MARSQKKTEEEEPVKRNFAWVFLAGEGFVADSADAVNSRGEFIFGGNRLCDADKLLGVVVIVFGRKMESTVDLGHSAT